MKLRKCLCCGSWFEAYQAHEHTCGCEDGAIDEMDEAKARIEANLREALDVDLTATRARSPLPSDDEPNEEHAP